MRKRSIFITVLKCFFLLHVYCCWKLFKCISTAIAAESKPVHGKDFWLETNLSHVRADMVEWSAVRLKNVYRQVACWSRTYYFQLWAVLFHFSSLTSDFSLSLSLSLSLSPSLSTSPSLGNCISINIKHTRWHTQTHTCSATLRNGTNKWAGDFLTVFSLAGAQVDFQVQSLHSDGVSKVCVKSDVLTSLRVWLLSMWRSAK